jgi:ferritin-like protein
MKKQTEITDTEDHETETISEEILEEELDSLKCRNEVNDLHYKNYLKYMED